MLDLLSYLMKQGKATQKELFPAFDEAVLGMPRVVPGTVCAGGSCNACVAACPTDAIAIHEENNEPGVVSLDRGACIGCGLCVEVCPAGVITRDSRTDVAVLNRKALVMSNAPEVADADSPAEPVPIREKIFDGSLAVRVVSTGCSACDLEVGAAGNPIFDMERFGVSVVASPRAADALLVTGPVGGSMKEALKRTYMAMAEPRIVVACGTCACSGGVHRGGYAGAGGVSSVLPVDVFIPGCPPHPWSIIHGLSLAMGRPGKSRGDRNKNDSSA